MRVIGTPVSHDRLSFSLLPLPPADIGANLIDPMFRGVYNGRVVHPSDLASVLRRSTQAGLSSIIATSGTLADYHENVALIEQYGGGQEPWPQLRLLTTVGIHPTRCSEVEQLCGGEDARREEYFAAMREAVSTDREKRSILAAIGECGLDYARLQHSPASLQQLYFERHFDLLHTGLPLFLHMREAAADFLAILRRNRDRFTAGVTHSFTGSVEDARELLDFSDGMLIGLNGCSLREPQGIDVARFLPLERIVVESDAPWCEMRPSHASAAHVGSFDGDMPRALPKERHSPDHPVKGRNEPSETRRIVRALATIKDVSEDELAAILHANTQRVFAKCQ